MKKRIPTSWIFFLIIATIYLIVFFVNPNIFNKSISMFFKIFSQFIYIFIFIFVLMFLSNYFIRREFILKYFNRKGFKKWIFIILAGILSTGPLYVWYPLLQDFKEKGLKPGFIACFLYNQAIKIHLLPILLIYFDLKYIIILTTVMIFMSLLQGTIINKLIKS